MESVHGAESASDLKRQSLATVDGGVLSSPVEESISLSQSSSSSASDSSSGDFFQVEADEIDGIATISGSPSKLQENSQPASEHGDENYPGISKSAHDQSDELLLPTILPPVISGSTPETSLDDVSATQFPSLQLMERPEPAPYRIPSSVFARSTNTGPMEWSVTSNDSLFSIHMGNMSFTKEQLSLFGRSGDLGRLGDLSMSGLSNSPLSPTKLPEVAMKPGQMGENVMVTEAAAETMMEVLRANADQHSMENKTLSKRGPNIDNMSPRSDDSGGSHKSFAFPILTEESGSAKKGTRQKSRQQPGQPKSEQQQQLPPQPQAKTQSLSKAWAVASGAAQRKWFSCFSCCQCHHCS